MIRQDSQLQARRDPHRGLEHTETPTEVHVGKLTPFPLWHVISARFYKGAGVSVISFINALSYAIILGGVVGLGIAIGWAFSNNFLWGFDSKREFRARLRVCDSAYANTSTICESYGRVGNRCPCAVYADDIGSHCAPGGGCVEVPSASACKPDKPFCLASMLLWGGQLILSLMTVVVGLTILLVSNAAIPRDDGKFAIQSSAGVRMFGYLVGSLLVVIWVAASLGGAAMELANVVTAFAGTMLICLLAIGVASVGGEDVKARFESSERGQKLNKMIRTNPLVGGITLMAFGILLPFFFAISFVNQLFRKHLSFTKDLPEEEKHLPFTAFGHRILDIMKGWNWARVLVKIIVIGLVYLIVQVGIGKVTSLFLAWLNQIRGGVNFFLVTVIVYFIGMTLFLIPAVPGVPVYVANGVMLGASGTKQFGNFWVAMVWAVACAFITKIRCVSTSCPCIRHYYQALFLPLTPCKGRTHHYFCLDHALSLSLSHTHMRVHNRMHKHTQKHKHMHTHAHSHARTHFC